MACDEPTAHRRTVMDPTDPCFFSFCLCYQVTNQVNHATA